MRTTSTRRLLATVVAAMLAPAASTAAAEPLRVFTTVPDLAALAREVGGDRVATFSAVSPGEDPHFAEARPSYIKELSRADVYIQVGMQLEVGYADTLLRNARNPSVLPGAPGYVVAAEAITPIGIPSGPVSRALGDVHGAGSPHFLVDPLSGLAVAELVRDRLSAVRPADTDYFAERAKTFRAEVGRRLVGDALHAKYDGAKLALLAPTGRLQAFLEEQGDTAKLGGWLGQLAPFHGAKVVDDHPIWPYFARTFGIVVAAHLEPKPGIQPTTAHLKEVVDEMRRGRIGVLVQAAYYDPRHARFVAEATGAAIAKLAHQVGALPGTETYLDTVDFNVRALRTALVQSAGKATAP